MEDLDVHETSYKSLTAKLMKQNGEPLMRAYRAVEKVINQVSAYVEVL